MPLPPIYGHPTSGGSEVDCAQLLEDISRYQNLVDFLNRSLAATSDPLSRKQLTSDLAAATQVLDDTVANYNSHCLRAPHPAPPFQLDPWQVATPLGIHLANGQWNTGSVNAVCPISGNRLLIGAEQGGLWMSQPDGQGSYTSRCLSNAWIHFQFSCLVADPANPDRVFAGCAPGLGGSGGVYLGNTGVSYDDWTFIPLPPTLRAATLTGIGAVGVQSMIILPQQRLLLVASGGGLAWAQIDSLPFSWNTDGAWVEQLANLEGDSFLFIADDAQSVRNAKPALHIGQISGGALSANPVPAASIQWVQHANPQNVAPLRIASCRDQPGNAYCLGMLDDAGGAGLLFVVRTQSGGALWSECSYLTNTPQDLGALLGFPESFPGPKSGTSIAVHSSIPDVVAAGYGGGAISWDGGVHWTSLHDLAGWHDDIHNLLFDGSSDSLFIPSDGGVLRRSNAGTPTPNAGNSDSLRNNTLPVVLLYAPNKSRDGRFGNLAVAAGMIAAGSQDNEDLWADPGAEWRVAGGGDGGSVAIAQRVKDVFLLYGQTDQVAVRWALRQGASLGPHETIPVRVSFTSSDATGLDPVYFRPVPPQVGLVTVAGSPVVALASPKQSSVVFGAVFDNAFLDPSGAVIAGAGKTIEWSPLGQVPAGEVVSSLEPHDSGSILAGTESGRLFRISLSGTLSEISFDQKPIGPVTGIASDGATVVCFDQSLISVSGGSKGGYLYVGQIASLLLTRLNTTLFPPNANSPEIFGVAANRNSAYLRLSFALTANNNEVWVSNSPLGVVWHKWVDGLPAAVQGSDIVITESATSGEIWLSTFGRGVWRLPFA